MLAADADADAEDAVIAALLLKMLWTPLRTGDIGERDQITT